jgi:hypothetical protein
MAKHHCYWIVTSLLASCALIGGPGTRSTSSAGPQNRATTGSHEPTFVPALTEVDAAIVSAYFDGPKASTRLGVFYRAGFLGPFDGTATVSLIRDGSAIEQNQISPGRPWKAGEVGALGEGRITAHQLRAQKPDFAVAAQPGDYVLRMKLEWRNPRAPQQAASKQVEVPFRIAALASTGGTDLGITSDSYGSRAAIRAQSELYGDGASGSQFWITLPTSLELAKTRVAFLFYRDGAFQAQTQSDVEVGSVGDHSPLEVPLRMWGWPSGVSEADVIAKPGQWEIHIVQDGSYRTTCTLDASGDSGFSCKPSESSSVGDAKQRAQAIGGFKPEGFRAQEVRALNRSDEVRRVRAQLAQSNSEWAAEAGEGERAETAKQRSATSAEYRQHADEEATAQRARGNLSAEEKNLRAKYERLVLKYGR